MKKNLIYFCSVLLALHSSAALAYTHDGVEMEPLFFGQIIINSTAAVHSCTIPAGGTMTCDSMTALTILNPGQYGVFRLSSFDPTVAIWASVSDTTLSAPDGSTFDVTDFTFAPHIIDIGTEEVPPGGILTLEIGATIKTRIGTTYDIAPYRGTYDLQINY